MEFDATLERMGFRAEDRPRRGSRAWSREANRFLTYWVHVYEDGTALFTWEFAIAEYLLEHEMQLGSAETLNLFLFPAQDDRGPQDGAWVAGAMERAEARLAGVRLADPEP
jgi:hypothetical protein